MRTSLGPGALCLLLAAACMPTKVGAADATLVLGRADRWLDFSLLGVRTQTGRWGDLDLVLLDAAYEPRADTEILLHFDELPYKDSAARYAVESPEPRLSTRERLMGTASAAFVGPDNSIRMTPEPGTLFWPGTSWQDFSIEFWLYPAVLVDGETLLSWHGEGVNGDEVREQSLLCDVAGRRLRFMFRNLFAASPSLELRGTTPLVPRVWHHHLLRFDARYGLIEYLVDGVPEAVAYATDTGREGGSISPPRVDTGSVEPLVIGGGISALMDELRVSRSVVERPALSRLDNETGAATSRVFDLGFTGTSIQAIEAVYERPGDTDVYFYYRMADRLATQGHPDAPWQQIAPGRVDREVRGRYLQLRVELLPDGTLGRSPAVSSITVLYEPDLVPAAPARLIATAGNGSVRLAWSPVNESDVIGYRVYYGDRPGVYQAVVDVGEATEHVVTGLSNATLYYFTVAAYDRADPTRRSPFAREAGARPSALN